MNLETKFWEKVEMIPFHTCWEWIGNKKWNGYGRLQVNKISYLAHRISYEIFNGPIPIGLFVCHKCDNPSCVNPNHLFVGTHRDNMRDRNQKGRANMPHGSNHSGSKLTEQQVTEIRKSTLSSRMLGKVYGVSYKAILNAINGKGWKHV